MQRFASCLSSAALAALLLGCGGTAAPPKQQASGGQTGQGGAIIVDGSASDLPGTGGAAGAFVADASDQSTAGDGAPPDGVGGLAVVETIDISDVWSGHPVAFSLLTRGDQQLAAFYDDKEAMTIAQRTLGTNTWKLVRLPTTLGWDSHNYVTMAIDAGGFIHVAGNMHAVPLIYFRSTRTLDISSFARVAPMVDTTTEQSCTYPQFFRGPTGDLVFAYRDGASGNGNYIFNTYNQTTSAWRRLINTPLIDGRATNVSAYPVGPILGPDGWYHIVWVWRDSPNAESNHDLSYAKSRDLVTWQRGSGTGATLTLPITPATGDVVDPVPAGGGIINNNTKIGFDAQNQPIIAYHKYDAAGNTQLYNARLESGVWVPHKTSSWTYRWAFMGAGTLVFEIEVEEAKLQPSGDLTQEWYHAQYGGWGAFRLDPTTLAAAATIEAPRPYPKTLDQIESSTAGMKARWAFDSGVGPDAKVLYMLRWETLDSNRDMARATIPPPTKLRLYGIRQAP
jgi:hypothetical protein